jgi:hypothetical protein
MPWSMSAELTLSIGGSTAGAEILSGPTCPPFHLFSYAPRDGACRHPEAVLDAETKSTSYQGDRFSRDSEKACIAQANPSADYRLNCRSSLTRTTSGGPCHQLRIVPDPRGHKPQAIVSVPIAQRELST